MDFKKYFSLIVGSLVCLASLGSYAQEDSQGLEFEFATVGMTDPNWGKPHEAIGAEVLKTVRDYYGGGGQIEVKFHKKTEFRTLTRVEYKDPSGHIWQIVPERVNTTGDDGLEFVTPPLDEKGRADLKTILKEIKKKKIVMRGKRSSSHDTFWVGDLTVDQQVNLILFIENHWPEIYRLLSPTRYGNIVNYFSIPLAADQQDLLQELSDLPSSKRTEANVTAIFKKYEAREMELKTDEGKERPDRIWKYRAANYGKAFGLIPGKSPLKVFELRIADLILDESELDILTDLVSKVKAIARQLPPQKFEARLGRRPLSDREAEEKIINLQNESKFFQFTKQLGYTEESVQVGRKTVKVHRGKLSFDGNSRYWERSRGVTGRELENLLHPLKEPLGAGNKFVSFGFECEFKGEDGETFDVLKPGRSKVTNTLLYPFLDPQGDIEDTGNTEVRSRGGEKTLAEVKEQMELVGESVGSAIRGYHLHMRIPRKLIDQSKINRDSLEAWFGSIGDYVMAWRLENRRTFLAMRQYSQRRFEPGVNDQRSTIRVSDDPNKDYIDLEIRGFMNRIDLIIELAQTVMTGLKNPEYIERSLKLAKEIRHVNQNENGKKLVYPDELMEWTDQFSRTHRGRPLNADERWVVNSSLRLVYTGDQAELSSNYLPMFHFERLDFLTPLERNKIKNATFEFGKTVLRIIDSRIAGKTGDRSKKIIYDSDEEANKQFRHYMKEWAQEIGLEDLLKRTLLLKPKSCGRSF